MKSKLRFASVLLALAVFVVTGRAADKHLLMIAGKPSHGYMEHEYRAGCLLLQQCLAQTPGLKVRVISNDWPSVESLFRDVSGVFNCGSGRAQTFNRLAVAVINAVNGTQMTLHDAAAKGLIEYIPFPPQLVGKYQNFTEPDLTGLRAAGYDAPFKMVEEGVAAYVKELQRK